MDVVHVIYLLLGLLAFIGGAYSLGFMIVRQLSSNREAFDAELKPNGLRVSVLTFFGPEVEFKGALFTMWFNGIIYLSAATIAIIAALR